MYDFRFMKYETDCDTKAAHTLDARSEAASENVNRTSYIVHLTAYEMEIIGNLTKQE